MHPAEAFLVSQFPRREWSKFPSILKTAYEAADDLFKAEPLFDVETALQSKGRLVSIAVDRGIVQAIKSGQLDCDYRSRPFTRPTGLFLELRLPLATMSISQVRNPKRQPRQVRFREEKRLQGQSSFNFGPDYPDAKIEGLPHYLLIHGHQELDFIHLGLPAGESECKFEWRSKNLIELPYEIQSDGPDVENTEINYEELNLLKEEILRWRKDNDI